MKKVTKKELRKTALKLLPAIYDSAMRTGEEDGLFQHEDWRTGLCLDAFLLAEAFEDAAAYRDAESEPKLKQLDQSVFDGLDSDYMFAAIDGCTGRAYAYEQKPHIPVGKDYWCVHDGMQHPVDYDYDTTNWQNSLIERDKVELTGSDLCRAMLGNGFEYVMCLVGDECEESASNSEVVRVICSRGADYFDDTTEDMWYFAIPVNNQGEPLTASEVGL